MGTSSSPARDLPRGTAHEGTPPAGKGQAEREPGALVPSHLCQTPHGAALTWAGGLQELALTLGGLLDFEIKT